VQGPEKVPGPVLDIFTVPVGANGKKPVAVTSTTQVVEDPTGTVDGRQFTLVVVGFPAADATGACTAATSAATVARSVTTVARVFLFIGFLLCEGFWVRHALVTHRFFGFASPLSSARVLAP
jgi:hypothetical protein